MHMRVRTSERSVEHCTYQISLGGWCTVWGCALDLFALLSMYSSNSDCTCLLLSATSCVM